MANRQLCGIIFFSSGAASGRTMKETLDVARHILPEPNHAYWTNVKQWNPFFVVTDPSNGMTALLKTYIETNVLLTDMEYFFIIAKCWPLFNLSYEQYADYWKSVGVLNVKGFFSSYGVKDDDASIIQEMVKEVSDLINLFRVSESFDEICDYI